MISLPLIYLIVVILKIPLRVPSDLCMTVLILLVYPTKMESPKSPLMIPFLDSLDTSFLVLSRERHGTDEVKNEDSSCENSGPFKIVRKLRISNVNRLIIGQLNINLIRKKSEALKTIVSDNLDILVLTESKLDSSFRAGQFCMEGFSPPFRLDRNVNGGGILIYVREDIICRKLKDHTPLNNVEGIFLELNLKRFKWLMFDGYNPSKGNIDNFVNG